MDLGCPGCGGSSAMLVSESYWILVRVGAETMPERPVMERTPNRAAARRHPVATIASVAPCHPPIVQKVGGGTAASFVVSGQRGGIFASVL
jgi:hypothetical protein